MHFFMLTLFGLATASVAGHDPNRPLCIQDAGRDSAFWNTAQWTKVPDGRILAFCFNAASSGYATIDQNWVTDIGAILQRRVDGGACCIDCSTAAPQGCTGRSKITNMDTCPTKGPIDGYTKDTWMGLVRACAADNVHVEPLDSFFALKPKLTIERNGVVESEYSILGGGDTC
jgi:hypothetical protein